MKLTGHPARPVEELMKNRSGFMSRRELMQEGLGLGIATTAGGFAVTPTSAGEAFKDLPSTPRMRKQIH